MRVLAFDFMRALQFEKERFLKKSISFVFAGVIAAMLVTPNAQAQCPLSTLAGTWVFTTDGLTSPYFQLLASGGRFVATVGVNKAGSPVGLLGITQTLAVNGSITRLETDPGSYQLFDDCSGGTLTFNTGSRPVQFDFFFINATEIQMVGTNNGDIVLRNGSPCDRGGMSRKSSVRHRRHLDIFRGGL